MAIVKKKKNPKFIQAIGLKKGALHKELKIPEKVLKKAAKAKGKLGERARFAITLKRLAKRKKKG